MKNIKHLCIFFCIAIISLNAGAQNLGTTIKVQAMEMATALMQNNFPGFVKYMHPNIIAFAGGKEAMKVKMDSAYQAMKRFNVTFKKYSIGNPGAIVTYKNQLQAILPQTTTLLMPFGEMTAETYMLVISEDKGKHWWFIDTSVYQAEKLKSIVPDISPKLVIPPRKKPKIVPAGQPH